MAAAKSARAVFPASQAERNWERRERELAAYAEAACLQVRQMIAAPELTVGDDMGSYATISELAEECVARLNRVGVANSEWSLRLCELIFDLHELNLQLLEQEFLRRERRLGKCAAGLRRLGNLPSSADLLEQGCRELVGTAGFGRAGISRLEPTAWRPSAGYFSGGEKYDSWWSEWINRPIPLGVSTPEIAATIDHRPVVVHDVTATYQPIVLDSGLASYVVAPVMWGRDVVGLIHADMYPSPRPVDDFDGETIATFVDGFSRLFERFVLAERLHDQTMQVHEILNDAVKSVDSLEDVTEDLPTASSVRALAECAAPRPDAAGNLTARESEVYDLLVCGAANSAIAERLTISEDTVKSHVKQILRKLGVANRAQAISMTLSGRRPAHKSEGRKS